MRRSSALDICTTFKLVVSHPEVLIRSTRHHDGPRLVMSIASEAQRRTCAALFTGEPFNGLAEWLRDEHKGGDFHIIIRRGKRMELSGIICIGTPPVQH